jgi:hypothetical protein
MLTTTCTYEDARALMGDGWQLVKATEAGESFTKRDETGELLLAVIAKPYLGAPGYAVYVQEPGLVDHFAGVVT